MYFVIGLGNPGSQYDSTRHNIGFEVVERFAYDNGIKINIKKHRALIGQGIVCGEKVMVVKPQTYMNLSGECVNELLSFYKEEIKNIIIIYDDTSLDLGALRIRSKGSAGGHNGIKSIISHLGTNEFNRIKFGVGEKPPGWDLANYVLSRFNKNELPTVIDGVEKASKAVEKIIASDVEAAMNVFN
ncbi:MAG: aminoacyl-tRNA hydrolase [Firmicutes bacterium HGW-Firmicutes-1]|jgi:PTH1 family peptidyl-tRNA hydrolase|nr:MAG: aminoacyl-tRNA hydrolase [Firmicutes bacterium HGW-Firmicutes-1]